MASAKRKAPAPPSRRAVAPPSDARWDLLEAARRHQAALAAAGLPAGTIDRLDNALKGATRRSPGAAAQVLVQDVQREIGQIHAAVRKEFPTQPGFQNVFRASEPVPEDAREVLAVGRLVAHEALQYAQNLIKYAINAATVKHLTSLCDQLDKELGPADPEGDANGLAAEITQAARRAFAGKPELADFGLR
jgi:hypothetical protein